MEDKLPETQPTTQPEQPGPQPVTPTPQQAETLDAREKEATASAKKKRFKRRVIIIGGIFGALILLSVSVTIYKKYFLKNEPIVYVPDEKERIPQVGDVEIKKMVQANSGELRLSLDYPEDAFISEEQINGIKKLNIIYAPSTSEPADITEDSLDEGYIFRISTFTTAIRDLEQLTQVKRDSFISKCPETADISGIEGDSVSTTPALSFTATNCNGDYKLTYTEKFDVHYEITQFFRGDFGYKQRYRAATEDILRSINFYPELVEGDTVTFTEDIFKFSFEHPKFDDNCCDITGPISNKAQRIIVLGDLESFIDKTTFDGIGIFVERTPSISLQEYIDVQRKILIDDYIVVKGKAPTPQEISVKVGDRDGIMLKGYSWRGNDLVYVDISNNDIGRFLIISALNTTGDSFTETFNTILRSFKFF